MNLEEDIMKIGKIEPLKDLLIVECSGNYNNSLYGMYFIINLFESYFKGVELLNKNLTV